MIFHQDVRKFVVIQFYLLDLFRSSLCLYFETIEFITKICLGILNTR